MYVFLNDQWVKKKAKIPVFDKGFMSAESVYETLRTLSCSASFILEAHYTRLERSALEMKIPVSFTVKSSKRSSKRESGGTLYERKLTSRVQNTDKTVFVWVRPMPAISPTFTRTAFQSGSLPFVEG